MVTVPAAIVVAAVYDHVHGGAPAVFHAVAAANPRNLSVLRAGCGRRFWHHARPRPSGRCSKGVREAVREYRNPQPEGAWSDEGHYGVSALFAVVASAVVIALVGVAPAWIYAGPLLAIVTATGVGVAFLMGNRRSPTAPKA
jgi:hypothetical protein